MTPPAATSGDGRWPSPPSRETQVNKDQRGTGPPVRYSSNASEWRNRQKANKTIVVAPELCPHFDTWMDINRAAINLSNETGISVVLEGSKKGLSVLLYGPDVQLDAAVNHINNWIQKRGPSANSAKKWVKSPAFNFLQWWEEEVRLIEYQRKSEFKRSPPEGVEIPFQKIVEWPEELQLRNLTPRDAFGLQLEALDSIRMEDEIYITLYAERGQKLAIKFQGHDSNHIMSAYEHYINLINKVKGKCYECEPTYIILDEPEGTKVVLEPPCESAPVQVGLQPRLVVDLVMKGSRRSFYEQSLSPLHLAKVQHELRCALESVRFQRGFFDMNIRFGGFLVKTKDDVEHAGDVSDLPTFLRSINTGIILKPQVNKWLGTRKLGSTLLERLSNADWLLQPPQSLSGFFGDPTASNLKDVKPALSATFYLQEHNSHQTIVVVISWTLDEDGIYEKMVPKFFKLPPKQTDPKDHLDINLIELCEGQAWHFGLESMMSMHKSAVSPIILSFADQVRLKNGFEKYVAEHSPFVNFPQIRSLKIINGRLDKTYSFGVRETSYQVQATAMWYKGSGKIEPCWGCSLHHKDWKMHLAPLETLPPGRSADFGDSIKTFFPDDGDTATSDPEATANLLSLLNLDEEDYSPASPGIKYLGQLLAKISQVICEPDMA